MKKIVFFIMLLLLSISLNAQENNQFVRTFTKVSTTDEKGDFEKYQEGKNTIVFNFGDGSDIKFYKASGDIEILRRISEINEGKTDIGREYQWNKALDEKGNELTFVLFSDGEVRMIYSDNSDGSLIMAISLIP